MFTSSWQPTLLVLLGGVIVCSVYYACGGVGGGYVFIDMRGEQGDMTRPHFNRQDYKHEIVILHWLLNECSYNLCP